MEYSIAFLLVTIWSLWFIYLTVLHHKIHHKYAIANYDDKIDLLACLRSRTNIWMGAGILFLLSIYSPNNFEPGLNWIMNEKTYSLEQWLILSCCYSIIAYNVMDLIIDHHTSRLKWYYIVHHFVIILGFSTMMIYGCFLSIIQPFSCLEFSSWIHNNKIHCKILQNMQAKTTILEPVWPSSFNNLIYVIFRFSGTIWLLWNGHEESKTVDFSLIPYACLYVLYICLSLITLFNVRALYYIVKRYI